MLETIGKLDLVITDELKKSQSLFLQKYIDIKSYKGLRIVRKLPRRGQRTHTNAKTVKRRSIL